jgi:hypothetical protein
VWAAPSGGSDYTETIVNISSAQIPDMSTTLITGLEPLGVNEKRAIDKIIVKFDASTIPYSVSGTDLQNHFLVISNGDGNPWFVPITVNNGNAYMEIRNSIYFQAPIIIDGSQYYSEYNRANIGDGSLSFGYLGSDSNGDIVNDVVIEDGNGFFEIKIYHKTITFGA